MDRTSRNIKSRPESNRPRIALRARYRGGEITVEARERAAIVAVVVLLVGVALATMVIVVT